MSKEEFQKALAAFLLESTPVLKNDDGTSKRAVVIEGLSLTMTWTVDRLEVNDHEP